MVQAATSQTNGRRLAYQLRALGLDGNLSALPTLHQALTDNDPEIRAGAAWGLGYFKLPEVRETLLSLLEDSDFYVRSAAGWGLVRHGRSVASLVREFARTASNRGQEMANLVLQRLATPPPEISETNLLTAVHDVRCLGFGVGLILAEAADDEALCDQARARLRRATASVEAMQLILRTLLDERTLGGAVPLMPTPINGVVADALRLSAPLIEFHQVQLIVRWACEDPVAAVDGQSVLRAVLNLLWNACKHSAEGSEVVVSTDRIDRDVCITVDDRGPGISPERRQALTQAFVRGEGTRNEGWGLGLFMVSEVCRRHHGRVEIEGRPGGGTRFRMRLPWSGDDDSADSRR